MVITTENIKNNRDLYVTWMMATGESKKLSRREVLSQDLPSICEQILQLAPEKKDKKEKKVDYTNKTGLYLLSLLTLGTVHIHRSQVEFLQRDFEKLKEQMRKKSLCLRIAEKLDRDEKTKRSQNNINSGSMLIAKPEEVDDIDLSQLQLISEQIGINGDPGLLIMDALPQWRQDDSDLVNQYGSVVPYSSQPDAGIQETFIEGNGSKENSKERRSVVVDFDVFEAPAINRETVQRKDMKKRTPNLGEHQENRQDRVQSGVEQDKELEETQMQELQNFVPDGSVVANEHIPSKIQEQGPQNELLGEPQMAFPSQNEMDDVPLNMQTELANFFNKVNSMSENAVNLPHIDDPDVSLPPPLKKQRVGPEEEEDEEMEKARRRVSSRPITPLNQEELTVIDSTLKVNETIRTEGPSMNVEAAAGADALIKVNSPEKEGDPVPPKSPDFSIDTQPVIPVRKQRSKKYYPLVLGKDLELDEAVREQMEINYSSLLRTDEMRESLRAKLPSKTVDPIHLMNISEPIGSVGHRLPESLRRLFKSQKFREFNGAVVSDEESDDEMSGENEKYFNMVLLSPIRVDNQIDGRENDMRNIFDEEFRRNEHFEWIGNLPENSTIGATMQQEPNSRKTDSNGKRLAKEKYSSMCLFDSPEKQKETYITEELDLPPVFDANTLNNGTMRQDNSANILESNIEKARQRQQKSSMGLTGIRTENLEEISYEADRILLAKDAKDDEFVFFSSGSLLPDNRFDIHQELLDEVQKRPSEWVDFNQFVADHTRKKAATAFDGLLLALKNREVVAKQDNAFDTIYVHLRDPATEESQSMSDPATEQDLPIDEMQLMSVPTIEEGL
ncbi:hypothetical protein L5515_001364 [Caenorhabditis briggsae]|uniref:Rad21/Rec8-like protein N-terminal domain-containing protein n=1 Tax=Caenorhabditis briggsae TaxID=6238 RepID=A0AAE9E509_CAEBR|nr:hypothetical protein L5515_001364 [Caenorhabditis briggsae]